jgi:nicotinate-nucleotide adenylyltransferase
MPNDAAAVDPQKIAFFGGTFDPVHSGHLILAADAFEQAGLDALYFVPTAQNPHKSDTPGAAFDDRLRMIEWVLAHSSYPFKVLDWHAPSQSQYAIDVIRRARLEWPNAQFYWIMGADQWTGLSRWHAVNALIENVIFLVLCRPDAVMNQPQMPSLKWMALTDRMMEISSTEIRSRKRLGRSIDFLTPPEVVDYIQQHNLYANPNPNE